MAKCRECKQTATHKATCSRRRRYGAIQVTWDDTQASTWPAGFIFDTGSSSSCDTSYDSGSSSYGGGCE